MRVCLIFFLTVPWMIFLPRVIRAQAPERLEAHAGKVLYSIEITGNSRTDRAVILRELVVHEGEVIRPRELRESQRRVRNTQLFSSVQFTVREHTPGQVILLIAVTERWTLIPVFRFGSGGGSSFFVLGLYDINIFGRYEELGAQYENFGGNHNGIVWFKDPRFLGWRTRFEADMVMTRRNRLLYERDRTQSGGFSYEELFVSLGLEHELHRYLRAGGSVSLRKCLIDERFLDARTRNLNDANGYAFDDAYQRNVVQAKISFGRVNYDGYILDGFDSTFTAAMSSKLWLSERPFNRLVWESRLFVPLPLRANIGVRFNAGHIDSHVPEHLFYVGGFDGVRGFMDGQFRGSEYWLSNLEFRIPSLDTSWLVLHHVLFLDAGMVENDLLQAFSLDDRIIYSFGTGLRIIAPQIYRLVLRIDVAWSPVRGGGNDVSFGMQQFF